MPGSHKKLMEVNNMTILCIILAAFMLHSYNIILGTAPGSFYKVSRHLTALIGFLRRFNSLMVIYTLKAVKGLKTAYRQLKTRIIQHNAPGQRKQKRHPGTKPARIAAGPDQLQPVRGYAVNLWSRPEWHPVRAN